MTSFFPEFTPENWRALLQPSAEKPVTLFIFSIATLFLIRVFGKANLTAAIPLALPHAALSHNFKTLNPKKILRNWQKALSLELSVLLFLVFLAGVFALPSLLSYFYKPAALDTLVLFSTATFLVLLFLILFVKELALFYLLLSALGLRASVENAYDLCVSFFPRCLAFGVYAGAVFLLFTFSLDLFILTFGELFRLPSIVTFSFSAFFLTWFCVLYRALWFFFFRDLATPPASPEKTEKEEIVLEKKIPETPSV